MWATLVLIKAFLEKDPILEINVCLRVIIKSRVFVTGMALRLRREAANGVDLVPPILLEKIVDPVSIRM